MDIDKVEEAKAASAALLRWFEHQQIKPSDAVAVMVFTIAAMLLAGENAQKEPTKAHLREGVEIVKIMFESVFKTHGLL